jgi:hypothetical protein
MARVLDQLGCGFLRITLGELMLTVLLVRCTVGTQVPRLG